MESNKRKNNYELILAKRIISLLDVKCRNGCRNENYTWVGFQNGNGTECGKDIERLIRTAKRIVNKHTKSKEA